MSDLTGLVVMLVFFWAVVIWAFYGWLSGL